MTSKALAVLDAVPEQPMASLDLSGPFEMPSPLPDSPLPHDEQGNELELDRYQIALVPFQTGQRPVTVEALQNSGIAQLLLLPLTWKELIMQVRKQMGHPSDTREWELVQFGQVRIDFVTMEVCRSERPVSLTGMEFKVLKFFVTNPNRVISRDDLLNQVWGYENYPCTRTVDNHVLRLRQKLEDDSSRPLHFRTVHGMGYKFVP
jgi:DNA-binding response OmpR family regulator